LINELRERGHETLAADILLFDKEGYRRVDVRNFRQLVRIFENNQLDHMFHLQLITFLWGYPIQVLRSYPVTLLGALVELPATPSSTETPPYTSASGRASHLAINLRFGHELPHPPVATWYHPAAWQQVILPARISQWMRRLFTLISFVNAKASVSRNNFRALQLYHQTIRLTCLN
jgi:hypothetical protein